MDLKLLLKKNQSQMSLDEVHQSIAVQSQDKVGKTNQHELDNSFNDTLGNTQFVGDDILNNTQRSIEFSGIDIDIDTLDTLKFSFFGMMPEAHDDLEDSTAKADKKLDPKLLKH